VSSSYSTDGTSGRHKMVSQILHLIPCVGFHGLGLLARFVTKKFHLRFYRSFRFVYALSQFFCIFSCYLPATKSGPRCIYIYEVILTCIVPVGGGVEYLHRSPAIRMRRRKGKSRIRDSKIWSRVSWGSDPRMTALARPVLLSERVPHIN
jgi:hypothetical protein